MATCSSATISSTVAMARSLWPRSSTPASSWSEMPYEYRRMLACGTKESVTLLMPNKPAVATPSGEEPYAVDMQPNAEPQGTAANVAKALGLNSPRVQVSG